MKKTYHRLGDWRRNTLMIAAAATLGLSVLPACSGNSGSETNQEQWSGGETETFSQGVITEMTETKPGEWKVTAERAAGKEEVAAILKRFDGQVDTLQGQALQQQMQDYSRQHPENRIAGTGMMDILMWSGIGYMAGRFLTPNRGAYANPGLLQQNAGWRQNVAREQQQGRGFFGRGFAGNRTSGASGIRPSTSVSRSGVRSTAPSSGRSSGFSNRGGGSFGG